MANDLYLDYSVECALKDGKVVASNGDNLPAPISVVPAGVTTFMVDVYRRGTREVTYVGRNVGQEPFIPK